MAEITELLHAVREGESLASQQLFEHVYADLKRMARSRLHNNQLGVEVDTTSLVSADSGATAIVEGLIVQAQISLRGGDGESAQHQAQQALARLRAPRLLGSWPRLEAEALLRLGEARLQLRDQKAGCTGLAHAASLFAAQQAPESPWLEEARRAAKSCKADR